MDFPHPSNYGCFWTNQVIPNAVHIQDGFQMMEDRMEVYKFLANSGNGNNQSTVDGIETLWDPVTNTYVRNSGQAFEPFHILLDMQCAILLMVNLLQIG